MRTKLTDEQIEKFQHALIDTGSFVYPGQRSTGYLVACVQPAYRFSVKDHANWLNDIVPAIRRAWEGCGLDQAVGGSLTHGPDDTLIHIDIVERFVSRDGAFCAARKRGVSSILALATGQPIPVGGS